MLGAPGLVAHAVAFLQIAARTERLVPRAGEDHAARASWFTVQPVLEQIAQIEAQLLAQETLLQTLRNAAKRLELHGDGGDALQVLLDAMAIRRVHERWFSPEQMRALRRGWEAIPKAERDAVEAEWPRMIREARAAMDAGRDPTAPEVQALVKRWLSLQRQFIDAAPGMKDTMQRMYAAEPELARQSGVTPELIAYLRRAKETLPPKDRT